MRGWAVQKVPQFLTIHCSFWLILPPGMRRVSKTATPPLRGGTSSLPRTTKANGERQLFCRGQGALTGRLTRASDVEDCPRSTGAIPPLFRERTSEQSVEKQGAQGFDGHHCQRRQKAREGRTGCAPVTGEQGPQRAAVSGRKLPACVPLNAAGGVCHTGARAVANSPTASD